MTTSNSAASSISQPRAEPLRKGMSQATTRQSSAPAAVSPECSAVRTPARVSESGTIRTPGRAARLSSLSTTISSRLIGPTTSRMRSTIGFPPTSRSAFLMPPSRVPRPPAKMIVVVSATAAILSILIPTPALAHVKWFEDPSRYPLRSDLIVSERTLWFIAVSAAALAVFYVAQRLVHDPHWPRLWFLHTMAVGAPTLLALQAAIGLVQTAVQPSLLAPNLHLEVNPF